MSEAAATLDPPGDDGSPPPIVPTQPVNWAMRAGVGFGIAVAIFVALDGLFWFILQATGILPANSPVTGWTTTMYIVWAVVAAFAGAGYALAPLRANTPRWWAWRIAGGTALAAVLIVILDSQLWYYLDRILPSNSSLTNWPSPLAGVWVAVAILLGARFALARSRLFGPLWWGWRVLGGVLVGLGTYFAAVWLPLYLVSVAQSNGVLLSNFSTSLVVVGALFALLAGVAHVVHPTRYYGPIEIGAGAFEIFYLVVLIGTAPYAVSFHSVAVSLGTFAVLFGLIVVVLISMAGDVVTTIEDFRRPGERRASQYPSPPEA